MTKETSLRHDKKFHQVFGGRIRRDNRFTPDNPAPKIRTIMSWLKSRTNMTEKEMARLIGTSGSTISMAAGGRAGEKNIPGKKYSTTEMIYKRLLLISIFRIITIPILNKIVLPKMRG